MTNTLSILIVFFQISVLSGSLKSDATGWLLFFTGDATGDLANLLLDLQVIINHLQVRLSLISSDIVACR